MHVLGKVFAWLTALGALAAVILTSRALQVRNAWTHELYTQKDAYEARAAELADSRKKLQNVEADLARTMVGWDRYWNGVQVGPAGNNGAVVAQGLGIQHGIVDQQVLYAFRLSPDGRESTYIGAFRASPSQDGLRSSLKPIWRLRPGATDDPANWSGMYRFRSLVPSEYLSLFGDYEVELLKADETFNDRRLNLAKQQQLLTAAQERLAQRMAELQGNPNLADRREKLPAWMVDGLVATVQQEEEARNNLQMEVDKLRHLVDAAYVRYETLRATNAALAASLPGGSAAPTGPSTVDASQ